MAKARTSNNYKKRCCPRESSRAASGFCLVLSYRTSRTLSYWPVPLSDTDCEVAGAATVTANVEVFMPVAVGVNVTLMVQVTPTARLAGQLLI